MNNKLLKTNLLVSVILIVGFALTAIFSYRANYSASLDDIEHISALSAEGIYYQLTTRFTKPVNVSLTMAHDSLLEEHLKVEQEHLEDPLYIETTKEYLRAYQEKYDFSSVFLVSTATGRYYNFNGCDRVLTEGDSENTWYFDLLDSEEEYSLNVDNDEVVGASNAITVFVNCKIMDEQGDVLGIVGVGIRIDHLMELLKSYEEKYHVEACLINERGIIEISTTNTGYEAVDWFTLHGQERIREQVLSWKDDTANLEVWTDSSQSGDDYVVSRYIPELSWSLLVQQDTSEIVKEMNAQLCQSGIILAFIVLTVLVVTTSVIRNFNRQILKLQEERHTYFEKATKQLYDDIYELNITKDCAVGERTERYFERLGAVGLPYSQCLEVIAGKQIKEEYREGYVTTFKPEHVAREYENGNNHLCYEFMITEDGTNYFWMRIDAYIFYSSEDDSLHMFVYRKNIDADKKKELRAEWDEMTGFYTKKATERMIDRRLLEEPNRKSAFFIFDIDDFKQTNDRFGHAFGDFCIRSFTAIIRSHFGEHDILGRVGGDEFVAFVSGTEMEQVVKLAEVLTAALNTVCTNETGSWNMSVSIGVAMAPRDGTDFKSLYQKADEALYETKKRGKNGYTVFSGGEREKNNRL